METNQNGAEGRKKLYIGAIVVLMLINTVTLYFLFSENKEKTDLTSQQMSLQADFRSLTDTLSVKNDAIEQFRGKNAELDKAIVEKQGMLDKQKKEIQHLLAKGKLTNAELAKAQGLIAEYKTSISDMTAKVDELTKQNAELTAQNTKLSTDLTSEKQTTSQLTEQNTGLSKKVEVGSLLPIAKVDVEAIKTRGNGKEVAVKRAKVAEKLKISFETGENKVLDPGNVSLYVRIINPKGETIALSDQGSGTMQAAESNEQIQYTKKADIDYDQSNKKVTIYWSNNIKDEGTYKVEVYQRGHVVGTGKVTLS
jgi:hypothetical protein